MMHTMEVAYNMLRKIMPDMVCAVESTPDDVRKSETTMLANGGGVLVDCIRQVICTSDFN